MADMNMTDLKQLMDERKLKAEDLDGLVHDIYSRKASDLNNYGVDEQLEFLMQELGYYELRKELERMEKS